jgi:hypothetical protein
LGLAESGLNALWRYQSLIRLPAGCDWRLEICHGFWLRHRRTFRGFYQVHSLVVDEAQLVPDANPPRSGSFLFGRDGRLTNATEVFTLRV